MKKYDGPSIHRKNKQDNLLQSDFSLSRNQNRDKEKTSLLESRRDNNQPSYRSKDKIKNPLDITKNQSEDYFSKKADRNNRKSFSVTKLPKPLHSYQGRLAKTGTASSTDKKQGEIYEKKINYPLIKKALEKEIQDLILFDGFQTPLLENAWDSIIKSQKSRAVTSRTSSKSGRQSSAKDKYVNSESRQKNILNRSLSGIIEEDNNELEAKKRNVSGLFNDYYKEEK